MNHLFLALLLFVSAVAVAVVVVWTPWRPTVTGGKLKEIQMKKICNCFDN